MTPSNATAIDSFEIDAWSTGPTRFSSDAATLSQMPDHAVLRQLHRIAAKPLSDLSHVVSTLIDETDDDLNIGEPANRSSSTPAVGKRVDLLQQWQGVVLTDPDVTGDFDVRLEDMTDRARVDEAATMSMNEVSRDDLPLVVPGAIFYLFVGRESDEFGQLSRFFRVRFRRLPRLTSADLARARKAAAPFAKLLGLVE
jgi:hypothetical protein